MLRFDFSIPQVEIDQFPILIPTILLIRGVSFLLVRIPWAIVRYTGQRDAIRILITVLSGSVLFLVLNQITVRTALQIYIVPHSIIAIEALTTTFAMISSRLIFKSLWMEYKNPNREKRSVLIFGAGESGIITKRTLDRDAGTKYKVLGFIDDDPGKVGKKLEGVTIYGQTGSC